MNDIPVKIENRILPDDPYKLEKNNKGYSNIIFLSSIIVTGLMWIFILIFCK